MSWTLTTQGGEFKTLHRRLLHIAFHNAESIDDVVGPSSNIGYPRHMLVGGLERADLFSVRDNPNVLNNLENDDERTFALYLYQVIVNDVLRTGVRESRTDSFVDMLLRELGFGRYPFMINLQSDYMFEVGDKTISAKPEFTVEKDFAVLFLDEDKHVHGKIGPANEYGECQIAAELLACAYHNFTDTTGPRIGMDQTIYATRVVGTRFTFYKAFVRASYLFSLSEGLPPDSESMDIVRFPSDIDFRLGYDFAINSLRPIILDALVRLRSTMLEM